MLIEHVLWIFLQNKKNPFIYFICLFSDSTGWCYLVNGQGTEHNKNKQKELIIPKDKNGDEFELSNLTDEQFEIAYVVLDKIREWLDIAIHGKKAIANLNLYA